MEFVSVCPEAAESLEVADLCSEHLHGLLCGLRHERCQKGSAHGDAFHEVIQYCGEAVLLCLVAAQDPGLGLVNIFVQAFENCEDFGQSIRRAQLFHLLLHLAVSCCNKSLEILVEALRLLCFLFGQAGKGAGVLYSTAKVFVAHGDGSVDQVSESVGQVGVDALRDEFPGDHAVVLIGHLMYDEIADCVHAEDIHEVIRIDDISLGLGHFLTALQKPGMTEDLLGKFHAESHQEDRPVDGMEADDILADQVQVSGPVLVKKRIVIAVRIVSQTGDVVAQRIEPDVDNVAGRKVHRDSPCEGRTGDTQILQSGQQEVVHHLVLAGDRLDKFGVCIDVLNQPVRVFFHAEEIGVLLGLMNLAAADGTLALFLNLGSGIEGLALLAVHAAVMAQIDVALVIELLENLLNLALVIRICGADEAVIGSAYQVPEALDLACNLVDELLGALACTCCSGLDLLTVLIGTCHKTDIKAVCSLVAGNTVGKNNLICVTDVRLAGCIGNCRCDVIFSFVLHIYLPPSSAARRICMRRLPRIIYMNTPQPESLTSTVRRPPFR